MQRAYGARIRLADLPGEKEQFSASMVGKKKTSNKNSLRSIRTKTHTSPTFKLLSLTKGDQPLSNRAFEFLQSYLNLTDQESPSDTLRMAIPTGSLIRCRLANSYGNSWKKEKKQRRRTDRQWKHMIMIVQEGKKKGRMSRCHSMVYIDGLQFYFHGHERAA